MSLGKMPSLKANIEIITADQQQDDRTKIRFSNNVSTPASQVNGYTLQQEQIPLENLAEPLTIETSTFADSGIRTAPVLVDAEQSSFEETLGVVSNKDEPDMLCLTFRSWTLGIFFCSVFSLVNHYFDNRTQTYTLSSMFIVLLAFPLGRFLAWILPKRTWFKNRRFAFSLNPGPFTIKEHTIIYNMSYVAVAPATPCDLFWQIQTWKNAEKPPMPHYIVGLIYVLAAQLLGYGLAGVLFICCFDIIMQIEMSSLNVYACLLAGILRRLLVWPSEMVWPRNFPYMVVLRTMNEVESPFSARWLGLTRYRFFLIVLIIAFVFQWFPSFIFPMLLFFPWWCLIRPSSTLLSQVTGPDGFAMGLIPINWFRLVELFNLPLIPPWWAYANMIVGLVLVGYLLIPILYYSNVLDWSRLPVTGSQYYAVPGHPEQKQATITFAFMTYIFLGAMIAVIVHTILFHGRDLIKYARTSIHNRQNDIHCTLIGQYKEAPGWIYGILFAVTFVAACLVCRFAHLMPWYYMFVALGFGILFTIPLGLVQALAGVYVNPTYIIFLIGGSIFHNRSIYNATFYSITFAVQDQALTILQNFKLGHYMKIAPRSMFIVQLVCTVISSTLGYVMTRYLLSDVSGICDTNKDWQNCPSANTNFAFFASIDLSTYYGLKSVYPWLLWVMIAIGVLPIFVWLAHCCFPGFKWLRHVHIPIMFFYLYETRNTQSGYLLFPIWLLLGVIFHKLIRRWWFDRYGFLFTLAMTMGSRFAILFIYFIFTYNNVTFPNWWGTQTDICPLASAAANESLSFS